MPLILPTDGTVGSYNLPNQGGDKGNQQQHGRGDSTGKHTRAKLERSKLFGCVYICCHISTRHLTKISATSFYPGRGDDNHLLARLDNAFHVPEVDDDGFGTDEDSIVDDDTVELALQAPNKFSESLAVEVSLQHSTTTD